MQMHREASLTNYFYLHFKGYFPAISTWRLHRLNSMRIVSDITRGLLISVNQLKLKIAFMQSVSST